MAGVPRPAVRAEVDAPVDEVPVPAQVKRSRMAFAMAVTVAALPILVVDNLPATADPERVEVAAADAGEELAADAAAVVVTLEEAVEAVGRIGSLSRAKVRQCFERRFTVARMAENYVAIYRELLERRRASRALRAGVNDGAFRAMA